MGAKAIIPDAAIFAPAKLKKAIRNGFRASAEAAKVDFQVTVQTWSHKPAFSTRVEDDGAEVATSDQVYAWVNDGTRPHLIVPHGARVLAFSPGGGAKTQPGVIRSFKGSRGGKKVFAYRVHHPGTEARKFDAAIKEKWDKEFPEQMQRAIDVEFG